MLSKITTGVRRAAQKACLHVQSAYLDSRIAVAQDNLRVNISFYGPAKQVALDRFVVQAVSHVMNDVSPGAYRYVESLRDMHRHMRSVWGGVKKDRDACAALVRRRREVRARLGALATCGKN